MPEVVVRAAAAEDAGALWEIEKACFPDPWSLEAITFELAENPKAHYIVATEDDKIVGYVGIWHLFDEGHIMNVAVLPEHRGKHVGQRMIEAMIAMGLADGVTHHTLEVRASNAPAIGLYEKMGFAVEGCRANYYQNDGEDALIMWRHEG